MMAANFSNNFGPSSRQHPHLPSHLAPLPPLEPSADRHHAFHLAHNQTRRGSTDPILHASLAANASASGGMSHGLANGQGSSLSSPSPFDMPRRRSIQIEPAMPSGHGSPFASPSHTGLHSSRFISQNNSPAPLVGQAQADEGSTLPPMGGTGSGSEQDGTRHAQVQSNYQFGSYATPPNPDAVYRHDDASKSHLSRVPTVSAPDGDGGGELIENGGPMHTVDGSRRSSASGLGSKLLGVDKDAKPYSRSPELRVSHKLAERKRRKEMKELFDDLRDQLPVDKGPKTSKWEILSKAVDHIAQVTKEKEDLEAEVAALRAQLGGTGGGNAKSHGYSNAMNGGRSGYTKSDDQGQFAHPGSGYASHHAAPQAGPAQQQHIDNGGQHHMMMNYAESSQRTQNGGR
ncbi:uncharacterized protein PFL1_06641 [Pseudozyma flocculosa PF-1]|uniref:Related to Protein esc1 n=2 Tax=Pseudozyma flocculosa TaxID=84751 RepID=A0A5C3FB23_9BASI|nr:uncharacterized protein PFL1_06641 [Pseudozyma flocculosa PF-1]EPQ25774.1 hypothetical protein PFL1_06641 [Pseudozyma flocculosa PF-1]SPO40529.1 related to Protein esc1 [Pseudozyma flocculosa]